MNFASSLKLIQTFATHSDEDLQAMQALLAMNPLPVQIEQFAPIVAEANFAIGFLLQIDEMVLKAFSALGMTPPAKS